MSETARLSLQYDLNNVSSAPPKGDQLEEEIRALLPVFCKSIFYNIIWPTELLTLAIWAWVSTFIQNYIHNSTGFTFLFNQTLSRVLYDVGDGFQ